MNVDTELQDYEAAGSLAEELPYWGWLDDERTCLTRAGELMSLARISPSVLDGQTPEQRDRVIDRWQRMLSGLDARTRFYFYLLRRPIRFPEVADGGAVSNVVTLGQRKRRAFLTGRVQDVSAYIAWTHDPGLSTVAAGRTGGPWWMAYVKNWMARRRNAHESVYLLSAIEAAGAAFRQTVDASRALVDDLTPLRLLQAHEASGVLSELTNRPGTPWDGATGSGMNWRLAVSELEAERRNLRLDGEPVVLYSLLSPPGSARSNLLSDLYRLDATLTVTLEWRPQRLDSARRKIRGAQRHYFSKRYSMSAHVQETEGSAAAQPARDYANPPRLEGDDDPPGWERIYEGSFLEAVLVTQLSGDFPGPVLAQVAVPFYSADRQRVLVPRGARVIGTASAVQGQDQERLAVSFHRLIYPDGRWVTLDFHGLNQVGEGALKDQVNRHYFSMFAAVGAVGIISGLTLQNSNPYGGGAEAFRAGAGQGLGQAAEQILQRFLNRLPTITIRAGHRLRIWFTSDVLVPRNLKGE